MQISDQSNRRIARRDKGQKHHDNCIPHSGGVQRGSRRIVQGTALTIRMGDTSKGLGRPHQSLPKPGGECRTPLIMSSLILY